MVLALIVACLLIIAVLVTGMQNSSLVEVSFISWDLHLTVRSLVFYASILGAAVVALLTVPKLVNKTLRVRRLNRQVHTLKKKEMDMEQRLEESAGS